MMATAWYALLINSIGKLHFLCILIILRKNYVETSNLTSFRISMQNNCSQSGFDTSIKTFHEKYIIKQEMSNETYAPLAPSVEKVFW